MQHFVDQEVRVCVEMLPRHQLLDALMMKPRRDKQLLAELQLLSGLQHRRAIQDQRRREKVQGLCRGHPVLHKHFCELSRQRYLLQELLELHHAVLDLVRGVQVKSIVHRLKQWILQFQEDGLCHTSLEVLDLQLPPEDDLRQLQEVARAHLYREQSRHGLTRSIRLHQLPE